MKSSIICIKLMQNLVLRNTFYAVRILNSHDEIWKQSGRDYGIRLRFWKSFSRYFLQFYSSKKALKTYSSLINFRAGHHVKRWLNSIFPNCLCPLLNHRIICLKVSPYTRHKAGVFHCLLIRSECDAIWKR